jgi:site-specific recombinase XerD
LRANNLKIQNLKIVDLNRDHVKSLLTEASKNRKWTNKTYNTHLLHLKIILYVLIEENVLESNPATRIKIKKVDKVSNYHKPASEVDIELIKETLCEMILILRVLYYISHGN